MAPISGFPDEVSNRDADLVSASGSVLPASPPDGAAFAPAALPLEALKQPNPGEYRQRLRKKMAQALESYRQRQRARGVSDQSGVMVASAEMALASLSVPITEVDVEPFIEHRRQLSLRIDKEIAGRTAADRELAAAKDNFNAVMFDLSNVLEAIDSDCPQLNSDDSYLSGRYMLAAILWSPPSIETQLPSPQNEDLPGEPASAEQVQKGESWRSELADVLKLINRSKLFSVRLIDGVREFDRISLPPRIEKPVRPTEEEVLRYLSQLEHFMIDRQTCHRALPALMEERRQMSQDVAELPLRLKVLKVLAEEEKEGSIKPEATFTIGTAILLEPLIPPVQELLGQTQMRATSGLGLLNRAKPSRREAKYIEALRKMMQALALGFGKLNEATTAHQLASKVQVMQVNRSGILAACGSWSDCLNWQQEKATEQEEADRFNKTRETKVDLLQESIDAFRRECADQAAELEQYLGCIIPQNDEPAPCDELRVLINAACWMVHGAVCHDNKRGSYPQY